MTHDSWLNHIRAVKPSAGRYEFLGTNAEAARLVRELTTAGYAARRTYLHPYQVLTFTRGVHS